MEEVSLKEDPSDLILVHPALDSTSAERKWLCTQLSEIKRKSYCVQLALIIPESSQGVCYEAL